MENTTKIHPWDAVMLDETASRLFKRDRNKLLNIPKQEICQEYLNICFGYYYLCSKLKIENPAIFNLSKLRKENNILSYDIYEWSHSNNDISSFINLVTLWGCYGLQEVGNGRVFVDFWWMYDAAEWFSKVGLSIDKPKAMKKTYLMKDTNTGLTKIGKSINPKFREGTLQSKKPTIELFAVCDQNIESMLHKKYKEYRVRGEWFSLGDYEIQEIVNENGFKINPLSYH